MGDPRGTRGDDLVPRKKNARDPQAANKFAGPSFATAHEVEIGLVASFGAVVVAAALVAPLEAAKVRVMIGDTDVGLTDALRAVGTDESGAPAPKRLWDGFGPLLARELPFTAAKLTIYAAAQQTIFGLVPAARERPALAFVVTVVCGGIAGAAGALLSAPADAVVTELASGKYGPDWRRALAAVVGGDGAAAVAAGAPRLFAGAAQRCALFAVIIAVPRPSGTSNVRRGARSRRGDAAGRSRGVFTATSRGCRRDAAGRRGAGVTTRPSGWSRRREAEADVIMSYASRVALLSKGDYLALLRPSRRRRQHADAAKIIFVSEFRSPQVQLVLFDFFRDKLSVAPGDLSLSLDVFADRLSFYDY